MGLAQLYYTSCEQGLSGRPGYQFNAATPGVPERVMREVERFTVYEPPRGAPVDRPREHPVNLCYTPDAGGAAVVARVVSSGTDPSGRPGNYFAHSLVLGDPDGGAPGDGPLPAELWDAAFWAEAPVSAPDLPPLASAGAGPLDRSRTGVWLARQSAGFAERLLTAADAAIGGGPPVVLVADGATAACALAALSHLLPPRRARRMAFATYCRGPEAAGAHVVGVPPGSDPPPRLHPLFELPPANAGLPARVGPDSAETAADPAAGLLVTAGPQGCPDLWRQARELASGHESGLREWGPVLAAATALHDGCFTAEEHRDAVLAWLPHARSWLAPADTRRLLRALLESGGDHRPGTAPSGAALPDAALSELHRAAADSGDTEAVERVESTLVRRAADGIAAGTGAAEPVPLRTESVRASAGERVAALLDGAGAPVPPPRALNLLRWASGCGLEIAPGALEHYGRHVVAGALAADGPGGTGGPDDPALADLVGGYPPLRAGAAQGLTGLPADLLDRIAAGAVGRAFARDRDPRTAAVRERVLLCGGGPADRGEVLTEAVRTRREAAAEGVPGAARYALDADLLTRVWGTEPGPDAAARTARAIGPKVETAPDALDWITEVLLTPRPPGQHADWRELAGVLSDGGRAWLLERLDEAARSALAQWGEFDELLRRYRDLPEGEREEELAELSEALETAHPTVGAVAERAAVLTLVRIPAHARLASALRACSDRLAEAYLAEVGARLRGPSPDTGTAARLYAAAHRLGTRSDEQARRRSARVLDELAPVLVRMGRRRAGEVRRQLPPQLVEDFDAWTREVRSGSEETGPAGDRSGARSVLDGLRDRFGRRRRRRE